MKTSEQVDQIMNALAAASALIVNPPKEKTAKVYSKRTNQSFTYKYADLADVLNVLRPALSSHGLSIMQWVEDKQLLTQLNHASGQWMQTAMPIFVEGQDIQGYGAALSYFRRYSLCAFFGIQADEDSDGTLDGEAIATRKEEPKPQVKAPDSTEKKMELPEGMLYSDEAKKFLVELKANYPQSIEFCEMLAKTTNTPFMRVIEKGAKKTQEFLTHYQLWLNDMESAQHAN